MKRVMIVLDDWEGRIAASSCWEQVNDQVDIHFLNGNEPMDPGICETF